MSSDQAQSVMKRMVAAAPRRAPEPGGAAAALRLALARVLVDMTGVVFDLAGPREWALSLAELLDLPGDNATLILVEDAGGRQGVAIIAAAATAALVEAQTMRRLAPAPPAERKPTRTDAAMCAAVLDRTLAALAEGDAGAAAGLAGFRTGAFIGGGRPLGLILDDVGYRAVSLVLSARGEADGADGADGLDRLGEAGGAARLILAVPGPAAARTAPADAVPGAAIEDWSQRLRAAVLDAPAVLDAVFARVSLPLSRILALTPGETIALPGTGVDGVRIESASHLPVLAGRLGQMRGCRAVRVTQGVPAASGAADRAVADDGTGRGAGGLPAAAAPVAAPAASGP